MEVKKIQQNVWLLIDNTISLAELNDLRVLLYKLRWEVGHETKSVLDRVLLNEFK